MNYNFTFLVAAKGINDFMACADLRPNHKYFIVPVDIDCTSEEPLTEARFMNIINKSFDMQQELGFCVPGIIFMNTLYVHETVQELSDGNHILFMRAK